MFAAFRCSRGEKMLLFKWQDDFRIGLDDIDTQHTIFTGYVNHCYNAVTVSRQTGIPPDCNSKAITVDIIEVPATRGPSHEDI